MTASPVFLAFGDALARVHARWTEAELIDEPPSVHRFQDATFVPASFTYTPDRVYHGGLLDAEGRFIGVAARQRAEEILGDDPPLAPRKNAAVGPIEAIYGGVLAGNYGHFLFETLSRLWPRDADPRARFVFHAIQRPDPSTGFLRAALDALDIAQDRIVTPSVQTRIAALAVPDATVRIRHSVNRALLDTAGRLRAAFGASSHGEKRGWKIYVSRTLLPRKCLIGEDYIEQLMQANGYELLYPELIGFADQVRLFAQADIVIGCGGSALHNILFSEPDVSVVHIAREAEINSNYFLFDKLRGVEATYLAAAPGAAGEPPFLLDLPLIANTLAAQGFVSTLPVLPPPAALAAEFEAERLLEASYAKPADASLADRLDSRRANPVQELRHRLRAAEMRLRTGDHKTAEQGLAQCLRLAETLDRPAPARLEAMRRALNQAGSRP